MSPNIARDCTFKCQFKDWQIFMMHFFFFLSSSELPVNFPTAGLSPTAGICIWLSRAPPHSLHILYISSDMRATICIWRHTEGTEADRARGVSTGACWLLSSRPVNLTVNVAFFLGKRCRAIRSEEGNKQDLSLANALTDTLFTDALLVSKGLSWAEWSLP